MVLAGPWWGAVGGARKAAYGELREPGFAGWVGVVWFVDGGAGLGVRNDGHWERARDARMAAAAGLLVTNSCTDMYVHPQIATKL